MRELVESAISVPAACSRSWAETLSSVFVELEFEALEMAGEPISGHIRQYPFGDLIFHHAVARGGAHRVTRSQSLIHGSKNDDFFVGFVIAGSRVVCSQDGHRAVLDTGDMVIVDSTREYTIEVPRVCNTLWIRAPRERLACRVRDLWEMMACKIDGTIGVGRLGSYMLRNALVEAPHLSVLQANSVASCFLDLLAAALPRRPGPVPRQATRRELRLLREVQGFIDARLDDDSLTPQTVADARRLTIRYLNKVLSRDGTSLARLIRTRRLERCRLDLQDPRLAARQVSEIAYARGFKNVSSFNRQFRAHFGSAPRAFRR